MCGGKTSIPPPPGLSSEEKALIQKQTQSLDFYLQDLAEQKSQNKEQGLISAVTSGLYDPVYENGKLVDATLNPTKVSELQTAYARNTELQSLAADRYERALKGEIPVSEGTTQRKAADYATLKESAARRGVVIAGKDLEEAALTPQDSTAGNELVSRLHKTYRLQEDQERQGALGLTPGTIGAPTLAASQGYATQFGAASASQGYIPAIQAAGYIQQPYAQDRELNYQHDLNQAQLDAQRRQLPYQLAGQAAGVGAAAYLSRRQ